MNVELTSEEARARRVEIEERIGEAKMALDEVKGELKSFQDEKCPHYITDSGTEYDYSWVRCMDCGKYVSAHRGIPQLQSI